MESLPTLLCSPPAAGASPSTPVSCPWRLRCWRQRSSIDGAGAAIPARRRPPFPSSASPATPSLPSSDTFTYPGLSSSPPSSASCSVVFLQRTELFIHRRRIRSILGFHGREIKSQRIEISFLRIPKRLRFPPQPARAFLKRLILFRGRCSSEEMERYAMHLLALSHVYRLPRLKRACVASLVERIDQETVIDVLQLARLCDAPRLHVRCMKLLVADFAAVEKTEGWRFLQDNDPYLELEILQSLHDMELREKKRARNRKTQSVYLELSEAMECLRHICTEGCTEVGPSKGERPCDSRGPCRMFRTCQGLQRLIRHFATCERKKTMVPGGGCKQCKRMWQLLRLHAAICDHPEPCHVPLCDQFKARTQTGKKDDDDARWVLLARKVVSARVMSALTNKTR